jgi:60S ribosome subunit biogenesis protein NIP7
MLSNSIFPNNFFFILLLLGTPQYGGVIIYSLSDVPLGFGIAAQPTEYCKDLEPGANVVLHQGDIGEYLRIEDGLF